MPVRFIDIPRLSDVEPSSSSMSSARQKVAMQRELLSLRSKVGAILDSGHLMGPTQLKLEEVNESLHNLELELGRAWVASMRMQRNSACFRLQGATSSGDAHHSALTKVFSEVNDSAAKGNMSIPKTPRTRMRLRFSTTHLNEACEDIFIDEVARGLLEHAGKLCFETLKFTSVARVAQSPITMHFCILERKRHLLADLQLTGLITETEPLQKRLHSFMSAVDGSYKNVPYHNASHACDVMNGVDWVFQSNYIQDHMTTMDHLMSLIAAAIHDAGHPGTNNFFQINTMSQAAVTYNDKSVLENMHVSMAFDMMRRDPASNWFEMLQDGNQRTYIRRGLVHMVLATDMAKHAQHVNQLESFVEEAQAGSHEDHDTDEQHKLETKTFLLEVLLHAVDISNSGKHQQIMLRWTERLMTELWNQGDQEESLGLPLSPLCNRATDSLVVPKGQVGFITFVVQPLFSPLAELIEEVKEATENLEKNKAFWLQKDREGATFADCIHAS